MQAIREKLTNFLDFDESNSARGTSQHREF